MTFAVATVLIAGVNLFALALIVHLLLGWSISTAIIAFTADAVVTVAVRWSPHPNPTRSCADSSGA